MRYFKSFLFGIALSVIAAKLFQVLTILYFVYRPHTTPVAMVPVSPVNNDGPSFDLTTHHYGSASMVMTVGAIGLRGRLLLDVQKGLGEFNLSRLPSADVFSR